MIKKNSKKLGYMDLGGNFVDTSNMYTRDEPVSGMANISEFAGKPKKPKGYNYRHHAKHRNTGPSKCYKKHNNC